MLYRNGIRHGLFLFPDAYGTLPTFSFDTIPPSTYLDVLWELAIALDAKAQKWASVHSFDREVVYLLTSNFSEANRMSVESEAAAYLEFVKLHVKSRDSKIVIKPHPRDSDEKTKWIAAVFAASFSDVVVLNSAREKYLPLELILLKSLSNCSMSERSQIRLLSVSTASLSFKSLFNIPVALGFGEDIVKRHFPKDQAKLRMGHERDIALALSSIQSAAIEKNTASLYQT
jgi:hypothetical protein